MHCMRICHACDKLMAKLFFIADSYEHGGRIWQLPSDSSCHQTDELAAY